MTDTSITPSVDSVIGAYKPYVPPTATPTASPPPMPAAPTAQSVSLPSLPAIGGDPSKIDYSQFHAPSDPRDAAFASYAASVGNDPGKIDQFLQMAKAARDYQYQTSIRSMFMQQAFDLQKAKQLQQQNIDIANDPQNVGKTAAAEAFKTGATTTASKTAEELAAETNQPEVLKRSKEAAQQAEQIALDQKQKELELSPEYKAKVGAAENAGQLVKKLTTELDQDPNLVHSVGNPLGGLGAMFGLGQKKVVFNADIKNLSTSLDAAGIKIDASLLPNGGDTQTTIDAKMDSLKGMIAHSVDQKTFDKVFGDGEYGKTMSGTPAVHGNVQNTGIGGIVSNAVHSVGNNLQGLSLGGVSPVMASGGSSNTPSAPQPDRTAQVNALTHVANNLNPNAIVGNAVKGMFIDPAVRFAQGLGGAVSNEVNKPLLAATQQERDAQNALMQGRLKTAVAARDTKKVQQISQVIADYNHSAGTAAQTAINQNVKGTQDTKQGFTTAANVASLIPGAQGAGILGKIPATASAGTKILSGVAKLGTSLGSGALYGAGGSEYGKTGQGATTGAVTAGLLHGAGSVLGFAGGSHANATPKVTDATKTADEVLSANEGLQTPKALRERANEFLSNLFTAPTKVVDKLHPQDAAKEVIADGFGNIKNIEDLRDVTGKITGPTGFLTDMRDQALSMVKGPIKLGGGATDTNAITQAVEKALNESDFIGGDAEKKIYTDRIANMLKEVETAPGEYDATELFGKQKALEQMAHEIDAKDTYLSPNGKASDIAQVYRKTAAAIGTVIDKTLDEQGLIDKVKNPAFLSEADALSPRLGQKVRAAKNFSELRSVAAPYATMNNLIRQTDAQSLSAFSQAGKKMGNAAGQMAGSIVSEFAPPGLRSAARVAGRTIGKAADVATGSTFGRGIIKTAGRVAEGTGAAVGATRAGMRAAAPLLQNPQFQRFFIPNQNSGQGGGGMDIKKATKHSKYLWK